MCQGGNSSGRDGGRAGGVCVWGGGGGGGGGGVLIPPPPRPPPHPPPPPNPSPSPTTLGPLPRWALQPRWAAPIAVTLPRPSAEPPASAQQPARATRLGPRGTPGPGRHRGRFTSTAIRPPPRTRTVNSSHLRTHTPWSTHSSPARRACKRPNLSSCQDVTLS